MRRIFILFHVISLLVGCSRNTDAPIGSGEVTAPASEEVTEALPEPEDEYIQLESNSLSESDPYELELIEQKLAEIDWCTFARNSEKDDIIYSGRETYGAFEELFVPAANGTWQYATLSRAVKDKDGNMQVVCINNTILDENAEARYSLSEYDYSYVLLSFDDGTDLRRVSKSGDGHKVYLNDREVTDTLDDEAPWTAAMIYNDQYSKGAAYTCSCLCGVGSVDFCYDGHRLLYALYKYTERLTEWKYVELFRTEDAFVGVYFDTANYKTNSRNEGKAGFKTDILDDEGNIIRTEDGDTSARYPVIPNVPYDDNYIVMQDEESGKYYYAAPDGTPLCKPIFDECTRFAGSSAVVWLDGEIYLLKVK